MVKCSNEAEALCNYSNKNITNSIIYLTGNNEIGVKFQMTLGFIKSTSYSLNFNHIVLKTNRQWQYVQSYQHVYL